MELFQVSGKTAGEFSIVPVDHGDVQTLRLKRGRGVIRRLLYGDGNGEKDNDIQEHQVDVPFGNHKKSSKYCHNVPSLCLKMRCQEAVRS